MGNGGHKQGARDSDRGGVAESKDCSVIVKVYNQRFNGSIFFGGGCQPCSRKATMQIGGKAYCTFHGNREKRQPKIKGSK